MSPLAQWPPAASPAFDGLVPALSEPGAAPGAFGWYFHAKSSTGKNQPCNQLLCSSRNYKGCVLIARLVTSDSKRKVHVSLSSWWKRSWLVTNKHWATINKKKQTRIAADSAPLALFAAVLVLHEAPPRASCVHFGPWTSETIGSKDANSMTLRGETASDRLKRSPRSLPFIKALNLVKFHEICSFPASLFEKEKNVANKGKNKNQHF